MFKLIGRHYVFGLSMLVSSLSFGLQIKGHVLNTVRDDEGLKVIVESTEPIKKDAAKNVKKKKTHVLYLQGQHKLFVESEDLLVKAKEKKQIVSFDTKKDGLTIIENLRIEK